MGKILNILSQLFRRESRKVITRKVIKRLKPQTGVVNHKENLEWIESKCENLNSFLEKKSPSLFKETQRVAGKIKKDATIQLKEIDVELGGGGSYPLLYFLTRYLKPDVVVETGVAAGFSSRAFLEAMETNKKGKLYSSDFPYFRLKNPEKYIGLLVSDRLVDRWELYKDGDENNLPQILDHVDHIDIFHYDSDKSYSGREFALNLSKKKISDMGNIIMDDIQDNSFFHDYIFENKITDYRIFKYENKFIGCVFSKELL